MALPEDAPGLVGHWTFDEGQGAVVRDHSGNGYDGKIVGAVWERTQAGPALRCDGSGDYVDLGNPEGLTLTGDLSVVAWVKLEASPYTDHDTNWYVFDCEEYNSSGWMLRVDGATATLCFRVSQENNNQYGFSNAVLENNAFHHIAAVREAGKVTLYVNSAEDASFATNDPLPPTVPIRLGQAGQSFHGLFDDIRVYDRALPGAEVLRQYKEGAASRGRDTSWFDRIVLRPFFRFDRQELIVAADLRGVLPLEAGEAVSAELRDAAGKALATQTLDDLGSASRRDLTFSLAEVAPGRYKIEVGCNVRGKRVSERVAFDYPHAAPSIPSPSEATVPPLPRKPDPPAFGVDVADDGGFALQVGGHQYAVESQLSYPHGEYNVFAGAKPPEGMEPGWRVKSRRVDANTHEVVGEGETYRLERRLRVHENRVAVSDTITNKTGEPIGILVRNRLCTGEKAVARAWLAGRSCGASCPARPIKTNPTVWLDVGGTGLGLIALDDLFIVQARGGTEGDGALLATDEFALDANASYTLEWAVYVNGTGDYYDFINDVRRDEGRNSVTVEGGFALPYLPAGRRAVPTKDYLDVRGAKYVISSCLSHTADDPAVSIEGLGFMDFPKERALMREQMVGIRQVAPDAVPMFHVAHSLLITNKPEETFADSRVIRADGTQAVWEDPSCNYLSKERQDAGWRWWIYYPTLDNSFGKALLESVDVMVDEMGCRGAFMDGFMWGYRGEYTYDRWDGHTAEIDPKTKVIKRKKGSVLLLSQPALVAFVEKMHAKGAVVIANNAVITRTIGRLDLIVDKEITEGPEVHLAQTPIAMGNMPKIRKSGDVYRDVHAKLAWGNLYMYYGDGELTHPSVPQQMYPITIQEIHGGFVKGRERLVTARSGVYGWRGDRDLHFVYLYDGRGYPVPHGFVTTVDAEGVRTRVELGEDEMAVVKRIPLSLACPGPVNVLVTRYGADGVELLVNGNGEGNLAIRQGVFAVENSGTISVDVDGEPSRVSSADGSLTTPLRLKGQTRIRLSVDRRNP